MDPVFKATVMEYCSLSSVQNVSDKPEAFYKLEELIPTWKEEPIHKSNLINRKSAFTQSPQIKLSGISKTFKEVIPQTLEQVQPPSSSAKRKTEETIDKAPKKKTKTSDTLNPNAIIENKLPHGKGRVFRLDGTLWYDGQYEFEKPHGFGKSYHRDGVTVAYEGEWRRGMTYGLGKKSRPDKSCDYIGQFQNGKAHGYGKKFQPDGITIAFEGVWENGEFVG